MATVKRFKSLSYIAPLIPLLLATACSIPFNSMIGTYWIYLPVNLGIVMALWWGPKVFPAVFVNALIAQFLLKIPFPQYYPLYALPETLEVMLSYSLINDRFKNVKIWKAHPKHLGLYFVYGLLIPATLKSIFQQGLFVLTNINDIFGVGYTLTLGILGDMIGAVSISIPLLVLLTPRLSRMGLSNFQFERIDMKPMRSLDREQILLGLAIMLGMLLITLFTDLSKTWFLLGIALMVISAWYGIYASIVLNSWVFFLFVGLPQYITSNWNTSDVSQLTNFATLLSLCFCSLITGSAISSLRTKIDTLKDTEKELKLAKNEAEKASNAKSEFLARMSHEIRTPLNSVLGMLELLKETPLNKDQERYINLFSHAGENLKALINDLLDFSKIEAKALTIEEISYDLNKTIRSVFEILQLKAEEKGLEYKLDIDEQIPLCQIGDPTRLRQVLFNLIGNAIKFTKEGSVRIKTQLINDTHFSITIEDTGIGIPREKLAQIFTPFFQGDVSITREYGGTGLGLVISKNLAEIMNGNLVMKSLLGRGSVFTLTLPNRPDPHPQKNKQHQDGFPWEKYIGPKFRILLVDDSEDNRVLICHYLKNLPFECYEATNGKEAFELFQINNYDLIFMDIQMPIMTGYKATELIRHYEDKNKLLRTPIIALTATAVVEDLRKTLDVGCDSYAVKPVKRREILEILHNYLIRHSRVPKSQQLKSISQTTAPRLN